LLLRCKASNQWTGAVNASGGGALQVISRRPGMARSVVVARRTSWEGWQATRTPQ
jgi:hypothetical protein